MSTAAPRLLLLLGQSPFDPTSGAAQSTRIIAEILARTGFDVRSLATTACEGDPPGGHDLVLADSPISFLPGNNATVLRLHSRGIDHSLVVVDATWRHEWVRHVGPRFDAAYADILQTWQPDIVLTYGGDRADLARRKLARAAGAKVVFALHNLAYRKQPPAEVNHILVPTQYLANAYRGVLETAITVLPPPLDPERVLATQREPQAVGFINPEPPKGATIAAQLADRLGRERPEVPLLVIGGRVPPEALAVAGRDINLDLTKYPNLLECPATARVKDVWAALRVVLMPSVVREAAGRCALEAMLNGVVPLVSNQGGLAEIVGDAGVRLPAPPPLEGRARRVPQSLVDVWWRALVNAFDDYPTGPRAAACRIHAERFTVDALSPAYDQWFRSLLTRS